MTTLREQLTRQGVRFITIRAPGFTYPPDVMAGDWLRVDLDATSASQSGLHVLERFGPGRVSCAAMCRRVEVSPDGVLVDINGQMMPMHAGLRIVGRVVGVIPRDLMDALDKRIEALPAGLRRIAEVIGYDRAIHLMANLSRKTDPVHGDSIPPQYIPKKMASASELIDDLTMPPLVEAMVLGVDHKTLDLAKAAARDRAEQAARALMDRFGGQKLEIPKATSRANAAMHQRIGEAMARGVPAREIAEQLCATEARLMADWVARGSIPADKPRKISLTIRQIRNIGKEYWNSTEISPPNKFQQRKNRYYLVVRIHPIAGWQLGAHINGLRPRKTRLPNPSR